MGETACYARGSVSTAAAKGALVCALAALFLIANRGAFEGYFSDDDLDNLGWTRSAPTTDFLSALASPRYYAHNFRPLGHLGFHLLGRTAGWDFGWYVALLQGLHLVNVGLVWLLLRRKLDLAPAAAGAGTLFFAFHMGLFDALWKPMYLFDVLCGLFCLLSLLCWLERRWLAALLLFWLALKSKEHAVMLPLALAACEYWIGERRWRRLLPFLAVSLLFGVQGLLLNPSAGEAYTMSASPGALWQTARYYSSLVFLAPYAGLAIPALLWLAPDRRLRFGLAWFAAMLLPLLLLPGRLSGAYLYVPLAGLAVAVAVVASRPPAWVVALILILWLPYNYTHLRRQRREALTIAQENRAYLDALGGLAPALARAQEILYDGTPAGLRWWGIQGAVRLLRGDMNFRLTAVEDRRVVDTTEPARLLLSWDHDARKLYSVSREAGATEASYLTMSRETPVWQLLEGWYARENNYRWIRPRARARLYRPARASRFELVVNVGPQYMKDVRLARVHLVVDGTPLAPAEFTRAGWQTVSWPRPEAAAGAVEVTFRVEPEYRPGASDPRLLGIAIVAVGFRNSKEVAEPHVHP